MFVFARIVGPNVADLTEEYSRVELHEILSFPFDGFHFCSPSGILRSTNGY